MLEALKYYYGIEIIKYNEIVDGILFSYKGFKYRYIKFNVNDEYLMLLVEVSNKLYCKKCPVQTIIISKYNKYYSLYDDDKYVLLRENYTKKKIDLSLSKILAFNNLYVVNNYEIESWKSLWERKVDQFELMLVDIGEEYMDIQESCDYYIGLAENAIAYYPKDYEKVLCVCHHDVMENDFYDSSCFIIDYCVRDIADYIKYKIINNELYYEELENFISKNKLSLCSVQLLISRLLFPSYYFDMAIKIINNELDESNVKKNTLMIDHYQSELKSIIELFRRYFKIDSITWL